MALLQAAAHGASGAAQPTRDGGKAANQQEGTRGAQVLQCIAITGKGPTRCTGVVELQLPFQLDSGWVVPNVFPEGGRASSGAQWLEWKGVYARLEGYSDLNKLWEEWELGILLTGNRRTAPLRVLEHPSLRNVWRCQGKMIDEVSWRKKVIYAIHRRVHGAPRTSADVAVDKRYDRMQVDAACADLLASTSVKGKAPTVSQLARGGIKEMTPAAYEDWCEKNFVKLFI